VSTGDYVVMAGQVGVRDHVNLGHQVVLGAKTGVMGDVPDGETYVGIPATPEREQGMLLVALAKLPEMRKQFRKLEKMVERLASQQDRSTRADAA
jgi:UDP-3-O-[3-hydroxymyristoyl] glucosamine N-acyltransferase